MRPIPGNCFLTALSPDSVWMVLDCDGEGPTPHMAPGVWIGKVGEESWNLLATDKEFPEGVGAAGTVWSPDGTMLVVTGGLRPVWLFQTGQWQSHKVLHEGTKWPHGAPLWSPDNKTFAITNLEQDVALSLLTLDGISRPLVYNSEINPLPKLFVDCEPAWSPDGKQIAYVVRPDRETDLKTLGKRQLWAVDIVSGKKQMLIDPSGDIYYPEWSPDGKKIAMLTVGGVSVLDLPTKSLVPVLRVGDFPTYQWSPDSGRLAVDTDKGLFIVSLTGKSKHLADNITEIIRWTEDGSQLIVLEYIPSTTYVHVLKILPVE